MAYHELTDEEVVEFKRVCEKEGIRYETDEDYREAAQNLYNFASLSLDIAAEDNGRKKRLQTEPLGFSMAGEGRNCSLCGQIVYQSDGWYDKWGFKCMNCRDAINKKKIPGSLCRDYKHVKYATESYLSVISGIHHRTIRKLINHGKIKVRQIPNGPALILRKDNPNLKSVIKSSRF